MMNIYKVHSEVSFFLKKTLKKTEENSYFLDFYASYCHSLTKYTSKFYSLNEHNLNSIIISTPKTQLFFTLSKNKPVLIYTPGVIRLVMQLLEKCAKKRKPVILNSIKFL